ncbi:hypothetical protein [Shewanella marisflavi]|uniref:Lipoprotein n=1 Tax=Shewanella marisflavi TaxID=260364 RepID=A0AAC9XN06_9GAMM|nr:hypothetical protein [Shewanella marisflavi]ASJ96355.1 hypothetical protein CFF01_07005 [Shewanella marisflavi]
MKSGVKLISPAFLALLLSGCHQAPQLPIEEQLLTFIECSKQQIYGIWVETDCLTGYRGKPFSGIHR